MTIPIRLEMAFTGGVFVRTIVLRTVQSINGRGLYIYTICYTMGFATSLNQGG